MCGFAGEHRPGERADVATVEAMAAAMAPRGPDGAGSWSAGPIALAHRRLKIIDLSEQGSQPLVDPHVGRVVVFNGCIYNHRELRAELEREGHRFFSTSDTEVIAKAHAAWGDRCVDRFMGMFAFALVERESGRLLLARDRLGIKPLYLADVGGALRFGSTLPGLVAGGGVDTSIDPVALHHYLSWHGVVPPPHTILQGVRKLAPATLLVVEPDGRRTEERYWSALHSRLPEQESWYEHDWQDALLDALRTAVDRRMVADVPVGVLLSGGLDSSLIVALLAEAGQRGLETFSIGFESGGGRKGDEFGYSDLIAREFATEHHRLPIETSRMVPALDGAIGAMSEPMVSHDCVAFYLLSEQVSRSCKVVQSGQGADEVLAGYSWYQAVFEQAADGSGAEAYREAFFDRPHEEFAEMLEAEHLLEQDVSRAFAEEHFGRGRADEPVDRALRLDSEVMLVDDPVKRVDNMTMAWGLEARVPFLDHEFVELAAACPPALKLAHGGKGVLKEASRRVLPGAVIDRPKGYFPVPQLSSLEGEALDLVRDVMASDGARGRGLFRRDYVDALLADPSDHETTLEGSKLWQVALLEMWLQRQGL
jgi:asparagine synthase (glutamine-hydrolysing)